MSIDAKSGGVVCRNSAVPATGAEGPSRVAIVLAHGMCMGARGRSADGDRADRSARIVGIAPKAQRDVGSLFLQRAHDGAKFESTDQTGTNGCDCVSSFSAGGSSHPHLTSQSGQIAITNFVIVVQILDFPSGSVWGLKGGKTAPRLRPE